MGTLLPNAVQTFTGPNGTPLSGGSVYFYIPGTTTPKNTWQDPAQTILNTDPVVLNANGQAIIWGSGSYRQVVYDANNNLIWDQVTEDTSGGILGNMTDNPYLSGTGFTPGTTTQLTLSAGPGSIANTWVYFDGVYQAPDTYSITGTTVTFHSPIPVGTQEVNIKVGSTVAIGVPANGSVTNAQLAAGAAAANLANSAINQPGTGQFFVQNGALVQRFNDRIAMGGATVGDFTYPPVVNDWFQTHENSVGYTNFSIPGMLAVETSAASGAQETCAATFAAQSLTAQSAGPACIAIEAYAVNNNASYANGAWAFYGEAHRVTSVAGSVYCIETDTYNLFDSIAPTPYQQGNVIGYQIGTGAGANGVQMTASISGSVLTVTSATPELPTSVIGPGCNVFGVGVPAGTAIISNGTGSGGAGTYNLNTSSTVASEYMVATPQFDSSAALQIVNNPTKWKAGIVFGATSLTGCDGQSGNAIAIALAKGHEIVWYNQGGAPASAISSGVSNPSNGTGIQFTDSGLQINSTAGPALAYFKPISNAANWIDFYGAASGSPVMIAADGSDTNVGITFQMKGTASPAFSNVALASSATSGSAGSLPATPAQYLILYLNGTALKVPAYNV